MVRGNHKDSTKIMKLRQMNDKLVKELKMLSTSLDKTIDKTRTKAKGPNPYTDAGLKGTVTDRVNQR